MEKSGSLEALIYFLTFVDTTAMLITPVLSRFPLLHLRGSPGYCCGCEHHGWPRNMKPYV